MSDCSSDLPCYLYHVIQVIQSAFIWSPSLTPSLTLTRTPYHAIALFLFVNIMRKRDHRFHTPSHYPLSVSTHFINVWVRVIEFSIGQESWSKCRPFITCGGYRISEDVFRIGNKPYAFSLFLSITYHILVSMNDLMFKWEWQTLQSDLIHRHGPSQILHHFSFYFSDRIWRISIMLIVRHCFPRSFRFRKWP